MYLNVYTFEPNVYHGSRGTMIQENLDDYRSTISASERVHVRARVENHRTLPIANSKFSIILNVYTFKTHGLTNR